MSTDGKYDVGYGKPPKHSRFQKGRSGNPKGRPPKKRLEGLTDIQRTFDEICGTARVAGEERHIDGREAMYRGLVTAALAGNVKAAMALFKEERELMGVVAAHLEKSNPSAKTDELTGTYLLVPAEMEPEAWEAEAAASQARLMRQTFGYED